MTKDGVSKGVVNILGKVTTLTHKTVQTFEDTVEVEQPAELLEKSLDRQSVYWKALPLLPGLYRLDIAIKDVNNPDHMGYLRPRPGSADVSTMKSWRTSSLILADQMNTVSSREIGSGNFIIGNTYIRPRVSANPATPVSFKRSQELNFWMQVYNLGHRRGHQEQPGHGDLPDHRHRDRYGDFREAAGIEGLGGAQRPVDGGENSPHGRPASQASTR